MSAIRCRACGAVLGPAAQWCSLCFSARESAPTAPGVPRPAMPLPAPTVPAERAPAALRPEPGALATRDPAPAAWPCTLCGARVGLDETVCPHCGAGFLAGVQQRVSLTVPGVGDVAQLGHGQLIAFAVAIGVILLVAGLVLASLLGHLL